MGEGGNFPKANWFLLVLYCTTVVLRMQVDRKDESKRELKTELY